MNEAFPSLLRILDIYFGKIQASDLGEFRCAVFSIQVTYLMVLIFTPSLIMFVATDNTGLCSLTGLQIRCDANTNVIEEKICVLLTFLQTTPPQKGSVPSLIILEVLC